MYSIIAPDIHAKVTRNARAIQAFGEVERYGFHRFSPMKKIRVIREIRVLVLGVLGYA